MVTLGGESTEDEDFYLTLQRKKHFTDQDVKFGTADVYIEVCSQGMSWYGNIDAFELLPSSVKVELSSEAALEKGIERGVAVSFSPGLHAELSAALRVVFEGRDYYREVHAGA